MPHRQGPRRLSAVATHPRSCRLSLETLEPRRLLSATVLVVNTTADVVDSGDAFLSLREAVLAANASPGDEVIQLPAGNYQLTRQGANEDHALTGDLDIRDHGSLKIIGAGRDNTIIDAGPLMVTKLGYGDRIFHVHQAAFEMTGLTVTGGTYDGALHNAGGVVSVTHAKFTANHNKAIVNAGVEYIDQTGWMSIDNTIIADNSGSVGGIVAYVDMIVTNSLFERNRGGLMGGAMLIGGQNFPHVEIRNSRFVDNEAEFGGAIQSLDNAAMLLIANSDFERNRADAGGAVAILLSSAQITSSRFIGNRATGDGGAIVSAQGEVLLADSLIADNFAGYDGGGIWSDGKTVVWNSTISHNEANGRGGGLAGKLQVYGSTIVANRADADGTGAETGGGVHYASKLHNSILIGNLRGTPGADASSDIGQRVEMTNSHNLIGDPASAGGLIHGVAGNIVGDGAGGALDLADVLQPLLAEHGGPTLSYMLAPGSPALDAGDAAIDLRWIMASQYSPILVGYPLPSSDFDQRGPGYGRQVGPSVDIGAVEAGATFRGAVDEPRIFYNNSVYDGGDAANPLLDHLALDYRKRALLPNGSLAEAANVTSYARGINGIMLDLAGSRLHVTATDFNFRVGASNDPAGWAIAPAPASVQVLSGLGSRGGDRIVITWPDGAIKNTYLQVIVAANENTGLAEPDTFFFGNRVGDTMQSQPPAFFLTNAADELRLRNAGQFPDYYLLRAHDQFDFDKSGRISAADALIARNHGGALPRIRIPVPADATPLAADALPANTVAANVPAWALREPFGSSHAEPLPPPPDQPVASPLPTLMARVVDRAVLLLESDAFVTLDGSRRLAGTDDSRDDLADTQTE